jgi:hypothetical protein
MQDSIVRVHKALAGLFPHADLAMLHAATEQELVEHICAAMWRLRGMCDAVDRLVDWNATSTRTSRIDALRRELQQDFVISAQSAFAYCAEALRELAPERRTIPVPDWKIASSKKRSRR